MPRTRTVLIAHPSADLYGSDLQLLETVSAIVTAGWSAHVIVPSAGPLIDRLLERGASVECRPFPVLRKSLLSAAGLVRLALSILRSGPGMLQAIRATHADVVLVNTVTIPWWLLASRLTGRLTVCHIHEAEDQGNRAALTALALPNLLAHRLVANSTSSATALRDHVRLLTSRMTVVPNGFPGPATPPSAPRARTPDSAITVAVVARLSPRKGIDVALDAIGLLRAQGRDVRLMVYGSVFPGYEWFEAQIRERATATDLLGAVEICGYVNPTWPALASSDIVVVPSRAEPFGNTAVEALLALRPLVASDVQGLAEIVKDGHTGLLCTPGDPAALAGAIARLIDDPALAASLADEGRDDALARFSPEAYGRAMLKQLGPRQDR